MIPKNFQTIWRDGLISEEYYLKLCGAGGGGFLLGMASDLRAAMGSLKPHEIKIIYPS
jgi:mevalonate kinase